MGILDTPPPRGFTRPRGTTIGFIGDSITAGDTGLYNYGGSFPPLAVLMSGGRLTATGYHGLGGETSTGGLARLDTALAKRPTYLHVLYGTNDIGQGAQAGQTDVQIIDAFKANMTEMYRRIEAAGCLPIVGTIPPANTGGQRTRCYLKANIWLRRYAALKGYPLVDYYTLLVKDGIAETPAGNQKAAYAQDGIHFNVKGAAAMAKLLVDTLLAPFGTYLPPIAVDRFDTAQAVYLAPNLLWTGASSAPGKRPDSATPQGAPHTDPNTVYSLVTDAAIPGNVQRLTFDTSATTQGGLNVSAGSPGHAIGDIYSVSGYFSTDGNIGAQVQLSIGGTVYKAFNMTAPGVAITRGMYRLECPAPATGQVAVILVTANPTAGVAAQVEFSFPTLINLTATIGETVALNAN